MEKPVIDNIIYTNQVLSHTRVDLEEHLNEKLNFSKLNEQAEFIVVRFYELGYIKTVSNQYDYEQCCLDIDKLIEDFKNIYGRLYKNDRELYLFYSEIIFKLLEFYSLKSPEYIQHQRERLYKELNHPKEFKPHVNFMRKLIKRNYKK